MKKNNIISGILSLTILLAFGLACNQYGTKLEYNGGELYYTKNVTEAEAKKLGEYLTSIKFFDGKKISVQLDKQAGTYQFRMVVLPEKQNDPSTEQILRTFVKGIAVAVFNNAPIELHICDDSLKTVRVMKI